jgi:hypothetical protein
VPWGHDLCIDYTILGEGRNPAAIFHGVENSPSTKTYFLPVRTETISLIRRVENSNSDNLYNRPGCHVVEGFLDIQEDISRRHVIVEI